MIFFRFTPLSLNFVNDEIEQIYIDLFREDSAISLEASYVELTFVVKYKAAGNSLIADNDHIRLVKLGPIAFFENIVQLVGLEMNWKRLRTLKLQS